MTDYVTSVKSATRLGACVALTYKDNEWHLSISRDSDKDVGMVVDRATAERIGMWAYEHAFNTVNMLCNKADRLQKYVKEGGITIQDAPSAWLESITAQGLEKGISGEWRNPIHDKLLKLQEEAEQRYAEGKSD